MDEPCLPGDGWRKLAQAHPLDVRRQGVLPPGSVAAPLADKKELVLLQMFKCQPVLGLRRVEESTPNSNDRRLYRFHLWKLRRWQSTSQPMPESSRATR